MKNPTNVSYFTWSLRMFTAPTSSISSIRHGPWNYQNHQPLCFPEIGPWDPSSRGGVRLRSSRKPRSVAMWSFASNADGKKHFLGINTLSAEFGAKWASELKDAKSNWFHSSPNQVDPGSISLDPERFGKRRNTWLIHDTWFIGPFTQTFQPLFHDAKWAQRWQREEIVKRDQKITGWWFEPLWKILVNWDDYSQYMGK